MEWYVWVWIVAPIVVLAIVGIFGADSIRSKKWQRDDRKRPSALLGPDKPDPPDSRRY